LGLLNNALKPNLSKRISKLELYKTLAHPTLLHGTEIWTLMVKKIGFESQK
jgi:hypothetical protein